MSPCPGVVPMAVAPSSLELGFLSLGGGRRLDRNVGVVAVEEFGLASDDTVEDRASDLEKFGDPR